MGTVSNIKIYKWINLSVVIIKIEFVIMNGLDDFGYSKLQLIFTYDNELLISFSFYAFNYILYNKSLYIILLAISNHNILNRINTNISSHSHSLIIFNKYLKCKKNQEQPTINTHPTTNIYPTTNTLHTTMMKRLASISNTTLSNLRLIVTIISLPTIPTKFSVPKWSSLKMNTTTNNYLSK